MASGLYGESGEEEEEGGAGASQQSMVDALDGALQESATPKEQSPVKEEEQSSVKQEACRTPSPVRARSPSPVQASTAAAAAPELEQMRRDCANFRARLGIPQGSRARARERTAAAKRAARERPGKEPRARSRGRGRGRGKREERDPEGGQERVEPPKTSRGRGRGRARGQAAGRGGRAAPGSVDGVDAGAPQASEKAGRGRKQKESVVDLTKSPRKKPYSNPAQASPDWNLKSQRRRRLGKMGVEKRIGLKTILRKPLAELGVQLVDLGLVHDQREEECKETEGCEGCWVLQENETETLDWVCGECGTLQEPSVPQDDPFFLPGLDFRTQVGVLWCLARGYSSEESAIACECSMSSCTDLLKKRLDSVVAERQQKVNEAFDFGEEDEELEADEIAFRCKAEWCTADQLSHEPEDEREEGYRVRWLRLLALTKRLSGKVGLFFLPDRLVKGDGRGGGGALRDEELLSALKRSNGTFRVGRRVIIHTDSAKAGLRWRIWSRKQRHCLESFRNKRALGQCWVSRTIMKDSEAMVRVLDLVLYLI